MNFLRVAIIASAISLLASYSIVHANPPANIQNLIEQRKVAVKICSDGYASSNYENGYKESNADCQLSEQLKSEIEQQGWCWRYPFENERGQDKYVGCDTENYQSALLKIDRNKDRPETSSLEAEWLLAISNLHEDVEKRKNVGFINFSCNDSDGASTMLSVEDKVSGLSGLPFKSELRIGYDKTVSLSYVLPSQSDRKTIVFGDKNTLQILRWVHDSVESTESIKYIARENDTNRQLAISLSNFTNQYNEDGPVAKRWAAHMHSMCESFSRRASRR